MVNRCCAAAHGTAAEASPAGAAAADALVPTGQGASNSTLRAPAITAPLRPTDAFWRRVGTSHNDSAGSASGRRGCARSYRVARTTTGRSDEPAIRGQDRSHLRRLGAVVAR